MDDAILEAMEAELATLDRKATAIRSVISVYRSTQAPAVVKTPPAAERSAAPLAPVPKAESPNKAASAPTATDNIQRIGRLVCQTSPGVPVPSVMILKAVQDAGFEVVGTIPRNVVSSALSRSPDFVANGRAGWTLASDTSARQRQNENGPPEGGPDAGGVAAPSSETLDL